MKDVVVLDSDVNYMLADVVTKASVRAYRRDGSWGSRVNSVRGVNKDEWTGRITLNVTMTGYSPLQSWWK